MAINWSIVFDEARAALALLTGPVAQQAAELVGAFEQALPAIQAGVASAEPFVISSFKLLAGNESGLPADVWAQQKALMQVQLDAVDAQVQQDAKDQP